MRINLRRILQRLIGDRHAKPAQVQWADDRPGTLLCLETGQRRPLLRRHLRETLGMTPEEYRKKWGLPDDYPMVSAAYAARRDAAKSMKLQG
ncbi:MucR family transcriptional regulator [Salipiger bermudensis]|uniref:Predicted transcriptional regulator n=1 Tax=Salipiger bermudensis (strain DSM 26914 / JCM 13377 / KCTC 12554 / HTCC2601) TaxID=314265 RepID=Q0FMK1_SALBH|nr:MucR family transcriptional regulator [Salipiger bermudensis]EAU45397.1 Predicted transcriptional regulator [Salipiger bermudensis HTCC2601]